MKEESKQEEIEQDRKKKKEIEEIKQKGNNWSIPNVILLQITQI